MINLSTSVFTEIFLSVGANRYATVVHVVVWTGRSDHGVRGKGKLLFVMFDCLSDDMSLPISSHFHQRSVLFSMNENIFPLRAILIFITSCMGYTKLCTSKLVYSVWSSNNFAVCLHFVTMYSPSMPGTLVSLVTTMHR